MNNNKIEEAKFALRYYFDLVDTGNLLHSDCYAEIDGIVDNIVEGIKIEMEGEK